MRIKAPSRLHITLIDLNSEIGRVDGGIGLALELPFIEIEAKKSDVFSIRGKYKERTEQVAKKFIELVGLAKAGVELEVTKSFEEHMGLGMGTSLTLSTCKAISELYKLNLSGNEIASLMGRGSTSGIGTAGFEHGGFILDGGHSIEAKPDFLPSSASKAKPAPVLVRHDFPDWKIAIVIPKGIKVHGSGEVNIFKTHCPIPRNEIEKLSHTILMKVLPAVVEKDISAFGAGITEIQKIGFKQIEVNLQSNKVRVILKKCQELSYGAGLSSFGPAIYCIVEDEDKLREEVGREAKIIFTKANNTGAKVFN